MPLTEFAVAQEPPLPNSHRKTNPLKIGFFHPLMLYGSTALRLVDLIAGVLLGLEVLYLSLIHI